MKDIILVVSIIYILYLIIHATDKYNKQNKE